MLKPGMPNLFGYNEQIWYSAFYPYTLFVKCKYKFNKSTTKMGTEFKKIAQKTVFK